MAHTVYYFCIQCDFLNVGKLTDLELGTMILAGACHDFEHPGLNNNFLAETRDDMAIFYNDQSVLENHHVAASFKLIKQEPFNIVANFDSVQYKAFRTHMINMILGTDMAKHFSSLGKFKGRMVSDDFNAADGDKLLAMEMVLHLADISNPTKRWSLCYKWTENLFDEFFKQGDKERAQGRPISQLMDRYTVNIARSQMGFLDYIVTPAYTALKDMLPAAQRNIDNIESNKEKWKALIDVFEEKMLAQANGPSSISVTGAPS